MSSVKSLHSLALHLLNQSSLLSVSSASEVGGHQLSSRVTGLDDPYEILDLPYEAKRATLGDKMTGSI